MPSNTGYDRVALREARQRAGLTRKQFADAMGRGYSTIASWETGPGTPSLTALNKAAEVLGVRVVDFLRTEEPA